MLQIMFSGKQQTTKDVKLGKTTFFTF